MKNILAIALIAIGIVSCKSEKNEAPKDYAVVHGTITNPIDSLDLRLYNPKNNKAFMVDVDKDGNFRDTLKLEAPAAFTAIYKNVFGIYLANDMNIELSLDTENFAESIAFSGDGEAENNFMKFKTKKSSALYGENYKDYLSLEKTEFDSKTDTYLADLNKELEAKSSKLDSTFISDQKKELDVFQEQNLAQYEEQQKINEALGKGKPSPEFNDYTNYAGGTSSLKDYRGQYVYIDVWATWCGPCKYEIPFLEKVEKQYHGKNIAFISLSIDNAKHEDKWRQMIKDKNMSGIQLLADQDYESQFIKDYFIYGIPRFIFLDPDGNVINYDAPRPSEDKLIELFDEYQI